MGFLEIFSIIMLVLSVVLFIRTITRIVKKSRYIRNIEKKFRLHNRFNIWIILIPIHLWIIYARMSNNSMYRGNLSMSRADVYMGIFFIIMWILLIVKHFSYPYISENCLISIDFNKVMLENNEISYRTDNDILEIYYKEKTYPVKYYIEEKQDEFYEILYQNYQRRKDYEDL
ncbi:MAG: hypothetical protein K2J36_03680 [Ruminococcus sp.]|nr:hypothetical protein [Ruminococcus sp.]